MFVFAAFFLLQTTFDLARIDLEGLSRFKPNAVLSTLGLKPRAATGKAELDAACGRLIGSGLFQGCNWKYAGGVLTMDLREAPAEQQVRLTVPGVEDKALWDWLAANEPLVLPQMPASDEAIQFYTQAIRGFVKQDVVASIHTNLATRENVLVFRPANVPRVDSVKFVGAQAIPPATLEKSFTPIAKGTPFTEYDIRQLLEVNVRPMYENLGHLKVQFPSIKAEGSAVTVQVEEGRVYTLGKVAIAGGPASEPKLPAGEPARWNTIAAALEEGAKALRNNGFLEAKYTVDRKFDESAGSVDLQVQYVPGRQFKFGALQLQGLNTAQESNIRPLWKLAPGSPMNEGYIEEFIRAAFGKLGSEYGGVAQQMQPSGTASDAVDVVITFRRK